MHVPMASLGKSRDVVLWVTVDSPMKDSSTRACPLNDLPSCPPGLSFCIIFNTGSSEIDVGSSYLLKGSRDNTIVLLVWDL